MSCTPPEMYRDRFVNYMSKVIVKSSSFNSAKNPLIERFKSIERHSRNHIGSNPHNSSNNILIQNNTNNFYNIINNNNNITVKTSDDIPATQNSAAELSKKGTFPVNIKYDANEVIKEESEPEKISLSSSKKNNRMKDIRSTLSKDIEDKNS